MSSRAIAGSLLLGLILTGCTKKRTPVTAMPPPPAVMLRAELDELFGDPMLQRAAWAALIQSLDNSETLYSLNAGRLMMPASNMKIVTLAASAERLGWDYRFTTKLAAAGRIDQGVLHGDLVVVGSGDPTIKAAVFEQWTQKLLDAGLRRIEGRIIGDDNAFDDEGLGAGWAWDYLADGYAAPTGALEYNDNVISITIQPGSAAESPVIVTTIPQEHGLILTGLLRTGSPESPAGITLRRLPGTRELQLAGSVRAGGPSVTRTASVDNPTDFFVRAFRHALQQRGIAVSGDAIDIDVMEDRPKEPVTELLVHQSPPLSEIATTMMKVSQNAYADTLLKALGATSGAGSAATGRPIVRQVLESWGITPDNYVMYDGSGLSRYNYVTAEMIVRILRRMVEDPKHVPFMATLPIAGKDGTLSRRMRGTPAEDNARAKTGSISNVRALSGYVTTAGGERLVFSILTNHFTVPQDQVDAITDKIVARIAALNRTVSTRTLLR